MKTYLALAAALLACGTADATTLATGLNTLNGTTSAAEPNLAGTVVEDVDQAFTFVAGGGTFSGFVQNRVVLAVDGTYDFLWRIHDTSFSGVQSFDIRAFRVGLFGSSAIGLNANYLTDGLGEVGPDAARAFDAPRQNDVNFLFNNNLRAGQDSYFFFLDTTATSYDRTGIYDFVGSGSPDISGVYSTFAPLPSVPEPATWGMFLAGFGMIGSTMRGRMRRTVRFA